MGSAEPLRTIKSRGWSWKVSTPNLD